MVSIAFSEKYFSALSQLEPKEQSQANKALLQFQQNPQHGGLHYEKLTAFKDEKLRSIRVNQDVRIILAVAEQDALYMVLYIAHHDDAYDWAAKRKIEINPSTGCLQVFAVAEHEQLPQVVTQTESNGPGLFDQIKDRQLLKLGVPEASIPVVRGMAIEADLENALDRDQIPKDAYEGLFMLMAGATFEEAYNEVVPEPGSDEFDTSDFAGALSRPESKAHFTVADNEVELLEVLEQSLEKWRVFLHPKQRRLANGRKNGPVRVLGGAGTGKTVAAMHRAKWLANNVATEESKVLFTTFTKNLAADIRENLSKICSNESFAKIEVTNLDAWVINFLKTQGYDFRLLTSSNLERELWEQAYSEKPANEDLSLAFFKEEWSHVIQPQSITSVEEYKRASRIGRGTRLSRAQRIAIWPVFAEYRRLLTQRQYRETDDAYRDARLLMEADPSKRPSFCGLVVDEAQDMGSQAFKLLRAMIPEGANDIFIVGDGHQRIYGKNRVVLGQCGINIRGRSSRLKLNYRTTDETRKKAVSLLHGVEVDDLDGGTDSHQYYHSLMHGPEPLEQSFATLDEQCQAIIEIIRSGTSDPSACCVVARTNNEVERLRSCIERLGLMCHKLDGSSAALVSGRLNVATMHRVKGLEFDAVFVASANSGLVPLSSVVQSAGDPVMLRQKEAEERALVYVSLTRARKLAYLFSYGERSEWF
ncbi:UvrD-helicase domain-containing protein [Microbulbifer marinus]|uniref:DNA 3'-5' helicase n=1 Tax=Microbulbifer marinus TaxID=658218 RepID=A0A1H3ZAE0_9GAMM|nr:UvrD-helicase domain-containing protein [Microbulbifer marinus]SEA20650.1 UvrD/REP helicase N-terminal domain-containing protein [Microbulbifer marinus]